MWVTPPPPKSLRKSKVAIAASQAHLRLFIERNESSTITLLFFFLPLWVPELHGIVVFFLLLLCAESVKCALGNEVH